MSEWLHLVVGMIAGGALLGVGLGVARPADKRAGLLLAGAGGSAIFGSCSLGVGNLVEDPMASGAGFLAFSLTDLLTFVLIAVAAVLVARALGQRSTSERSS